MPRWPIYRANSHTKFETPSPKYIGTSKSAETPVSATSISLDSFWSQEKSPFGLSIPALEASSASEMTVDCITAFREPDLQMKETGQAKDLPDEPLWSSPPSFSGFACTTSSPQKKRDHPEDEILWMPPLTPSEDLQGLDTLKRDSEKPVKEPKKHHRTSSDVSMDMACRMPRRTKSSSKNKRVSRRAREDSIQVDRWEEPRKERTKPGRQRSSLKTKRDVAPSFTRTRTQEEPASCTRNRTVAVPVVTDTEEENDKSALLNTRRGRRHSDNLQDLRTSEVTNRGRRRSDAKPRSTGTLMERKTPSSPRSLRRTSSRITSRGTVLPDKEEPKRQKSGNLRQLRCRPSRSFKNSNLRQNSNSQRIPARTNSSSLRRSFRRSASGFGSFLKHVPARTTSKQGSNLHRRSAAPLKAPLPTEMNIFCSSEFVSHDFIIGQVFEAKNNPDIVSLEIEDLLERSTADIALALRDLLSCDDRPWEGVNFVDEVQMDGSSSYFPWIQQRKQFLRHLGNVGALKLIPITFTTKLTVEDHNGNNRYSDVVTLLQEIQMDPTVTELKLITKDSTLGVLQELTQLFQCDTRRWSAVHLTLSGEGPYPKGSPEHADWCRDMQTAGRLMKQVSQDRGILLT